METFDAIAENLLKENGYEIDHCRSKVEAIRKAAALREGPSISGTFPEIGYERRKGWRIDYHIGGDV